MDEQYRNLIATQLYVLTLCGHYVVYLVFLRLKKYSSRASEYLHDRGHCGYSALGGGHLSMRLSKTRSTNVFRSLLRSG